MLEGHFGQIDYSGFDRENWPHRTRQAHIEAINSLSTCKKISRPKIESTSGFRYTIMLRLPYFDASRILIVDLMHNLFLGLGCIFFNYCIAWTTAQWMLEAFCAGLQDSCTSYSN